MTTFLYVIMPLFFLLACGWLFYSKFFPKKEVVPNVLLEPFERDVMEIRVSKGDEQSAVLHFSSLASENMFASLHGLLREDQSVQEHFSFEMVSDIDGIKFYVVTPKDISKFVENQIYAQYPGAQIKMVDDYTSKADLTSASVVVSDILLSKDAMFPIRTFRDMETDPLSGLTSAISEVGPSERLWLQVLARPIPDVWQADGHAYVNTIRNGLTQPKSDPILSTLSKLIVKEITAIFVTMVTQIFTSPSATVASAKDAGKPVGPPRLAPGQELELKAIENKLTKMGYLVGIRVVSQAGTPERAESLSRSLIASMKQFSLAKLNGFVSAKVSDISSGLQSYMDRLFTSSSTFVLNVEELATIYHLPSANLETPSISWAYSKKAEPPAGLPTKDCTYIGETLFRSEKVRFGLANTDDRLRHMYLIGKSGTGKSTLLETMITQDIWNGYGVGVLDPHGETIDKILERIPDHRMDDVVIVDPSDVERPIGINLFEMQDMSQKNLMASALISAIRHNFDYSWGPRLEYLLNYALLTLLEVPGTSMLGITRVLEDDNYRNYILHFVKDPVVIKFWEKEFKEMKGNQKLVTEAIAPIQNKVNRFLASSTIRNILGQKKSTVDIWDIMNSGKILLMNLSKGKIGEDNANLLGAMLVSRVQFMALQRAKIPYDERRPFYLYVDEFQNFATGSFESILSESRKYKLGLHLTHQYTAQLPEQLLKAVFGNVGTIASFSLGAPDAKALSNEFAPYFDSTDIISLERFHIYIKLMINGMTSLPFSAKILLPWESEAPFFKKTGNKEKAIELSRQKYGVERSFVESKINRWVETKFDKGMAIAQEIKARKVAEENGSTNEPNRSDSSSTSDAESIR